MPHALPLITTISVALALALILGVAASYLKTPVLVGYLANIAAVVGDALNSTVLQQLHIAQARMLVIAIPNMFNVLKIAKTGRKFNSTIKIVIRTHSENETHL